MLGVILVEACYISDAGDYFDIAYNRHMTTNPSISDLQLQIDEFCSEREWHQFHNYKDLAISLLLEASEVLEMFQWKTADEIDQSIVRIKSATTEELADVLYWTLLIANKLDVDLTKAFQTKMLINATKYPVEKAKGNHLKYDQL